MIQDLVGRIRKPGERGSKGRERTWDVCNWNSRKYPVVVPNSVLLKTCL